MQHVLRWWRLEQSFWIRHLLLNAYQTQLNNLLVWGFFHWIKQNMLLLESYSPVKELWHINININRLTIRLKMEINYHTVVFNYISGNEFAASSALRRHEHNPIDVRAIRYSHLSPFVVPVRTLFFSFWLETVFTARSSLYDHKFCPPSKNPSRLPTEYQVWSPCAVAGQKLVAHVQTDRRTDWCPTRHFNSLMISTPYLDFVKNRNQPTLFFFNDATKEKLGCFIAKWS